MRLFLSLANLTRPIASLTVALLFLSGATMSPRAMAQSASQGYVTGQASTSPKDIYVDTLNNPQNIYIAPPSNTDSSGIASPELRAFLDTIAWAETGTTEAISYQTLVFNGLFNDFSTHPKIKQCGSIGGRRVCSNAAGRYQIMGFNWDELAPKLGLKDFSPASQDQMALYFIQRKGAMEDVLAGRFEKATCKVGKIWASLPCNNYKQHPKSMSVLKQFYQQQLSLHRDSDGSFSTIR